MEDVTKLRMIRKNLENIPQAPLLRGFTIRWFVPGDEQHWVQIHLLAERYHTATEALHREQFGTDMDELAKRQCFLCGPDGEPIGTASAWYGKPAPGPQWGRVHRVAIVPAMQGQGLSKPLLTCVCSRLHELGHRCAYLTTETPRIPTIGLYLSFGFKPEIRSPADRDAWRRVKDAGLEIDV